MGKINSPALFFKYPGSYLMEMGRRTFALSLLPGLLESQWENHESLRLKQVAMLKEYLEYCRQEIPYYARLFEEYNFQSTGLESKRDLASLPLLEKGIVRQQYQELKPGNFARLVTRSKVTSGSTGVPLDFHLDSNSHSYLWAHIWRAWAQVKYSPGDIYATLAGGALLPDEVSAMKKLYMALSRSVNMPCYHMSDQLLDRYSRMVEEQELKILYGYPSSIELLARYVLSKTACKPLVNAVVTTSELLTSTAREMIEQAFGCSVFDTYGCNDAGLYAFECEAHDGYHVGMESVVVEVVDDQGKPLPEGVVGRIVTTHVANSCFPLVRYVTGDLGALSYSPCSCGRGLERIVKLQGREADYVRTPDGRKILHPFFLFFEPFHELKWIQRWQIYQPRIDKVVVRLQSSLVPTSEDKGRIIEEMKKGLGDIEITVELVSEMETTKKGKFRMIVSDLE